MIEAEERHHAKLLSLLRITKFTMKGFKALLSSLWTQNTKLHIKKTTTNYLTENISSRKTENNYNYNAIYINKPSD